MKKSKEVLTREVDYVIVDDVLNEPFEVFASVPGSGSDAWWSSKEKGKPKVEALFEAFKKCYRITDAIVLAKISYAQWEYFNLIHPKFKEAKERCENIVHMMAKESLTKAIQSDWKPAAWFLERREPELFGKRESTPLGLIPQGGSQVSQLIEAFVDKDGKLISKRKTITITNGEQNPN